VDVIDVEECCESVRVGSYAPKILLLTDVIVPVSIEVTLREMSAVQHIFRSPLADRKRGKRDCA
jgi:hypothetical protein